ncbi:uncharacterized protein [Montipora capricornis]|uniref:uncharacterized protein n=1 Tax=Montipora capricornis TaxID=246305 RepID=UPI0035F1D97B
MTVSTLDHPLNPVLFDILLRFRVQEDIEKAFLNIEIDPEHRDFARFLWVKDPNKESLEVMALCFAHVVFGVNFSPFILNDIIRHHLNTCLPVYSALARELLKTLYVDDYVSGNGDMNSAFKLSKEIKLCLKSGGFNMRKWSSNSESVLRLLKKKMKLAVRFLKRAIELELKMKMKASLNQLKRSKGFWECFGTQPHSRHQSLGSTQGSGKLYGSLETFPPSVKRRALVSRLNPAQDELIYDLNKTLGDADAQLATRRLILSTATRFFDPLGLVAPVILPFEMMCQKLCKAGKDWDELVDAELNHQRLATLSDLRQAGRVSFKRCYAEGLNGGKVKFYDFTVVNHKHWQEVQAVCRESRRNSPPEQWRYFSKADNPADIASRGIKSTELKESSLWLHGPDSLSKSSEQWPVQPTVVPVREELSELKSSKLAVTSLVTTFVEGKQEEPSLDNLINPKNYSSLKTLMLLFTEKLKKTRSREGTEDFTKLHRQAEMLRIKHVRQEILKCDKYPQMKSTLGLYQDEEGILRCQRRIGMPSLPYDTRFPMLLPRSH